MSIAGIWFIWIELFSKLLVGIVTIGGSIFWTTGVYSFWIGSNPKLGIEFNSSWFILFHAGIVSIGLCVWAGSIGLNAWTGSIGLISSIGLNVWTGSIGLISSVGLYVWTGSIGLISSTGLYVWTGSIGLISSVGLNIWTGSTDLTSSTELCCWIGLIDSTGSGILIVSNFLFWSKLFSWACIWYIELNEFTSSAGWVFSIGSITVWVWFNSSSGLILRGLPLPLLGLSSTSSIGVLRGLPLPLFTSCAKSCSFSPISSVSFFSK